MNTETPIESGAAESLGLRRLNKADGLKLALALLDEVKEGNRDPLDVLERIKQHQAALSILTEKDEKKNKFFPVAKEFEKLYMEAAAKNPIKFSYGNADFRTGEAGTKYYYENCNDPVLIELLKQQEEINLKVSNREAFLKSVDPAGMEILLDDGEVVTVYPPYKKSTTTLFVTLK